MGQSFIAGKQYYYQAFLLAALFIAGPANKAHGQQMEGNDSLKTEKLEDVVISTRVSAVSQNRGQSVTIITAEQIKALPVSTLDELLRYLPGLDMAQRGAFGAQSDINARGSRFNQNLVVVNGIPANDPLTGHFNANFMVSPGEIERIEIVRGPSSLAYGGSGIGVTIHIYTYGFDTGQKDSAQFRSNMRLSSGSYEQQEMAFTARYQMQGYYLGGSIWNYNHTGVSRPDTSSTFMKRRQYGIHAGGVINDHVRFALRGFAGESDFDARHFYTASVLDKSVESLDRLRGEAAVFYRHSDHLQMDVRYSFMQTKDRFAFVPESVNRHNSQLHTVQVNNQWNKNLTFISWGLQGMSGTLKSNDRGNREKQNVDIYGIVSHYLNQLNQTGVRYGLRLRVDDAGNLNWMPQVWVNHYMGKWVLRGGSGIATRTPTYTEYFVSTGLTSLAGGRNLGNPGLEDEFTFNSELGLDWKPKAGIVLGATVWHRASSDLIDYILTQGSEIPDAHNVSDTLSYFYAVNLGKMNNVGAEFTFNHRGTVDHAKISWEYMVAYSFNHLLNSSDFDGTKYLLSSARNLVNINGAVEVKWLRFSSTFLYKERRQVESNTVLRVPSPQYMVWNPGVGLIIPGGYVEFSARNVFDTRFYDIGGVQQPGRWFVFMIKAGI